MQIQEPRFLETTSEIASANEFLMRFKSKGSASCCTRSLESPLSLEPVGHHGSDIPDSGCV